MTTLELAKLVKSARDAQRRYFRYRQAADLDRSMVLERELDQTVASILESEQTPLFNQEKP